MDWIGEVWRACPSRFKQGFDWSSSGNSYAADQPTWDKMKPGMVKWQSFMRSDDTAKAHDIVCELKPLLLSTQWFSNYKGKVEGCLAAACQANPNGECVAICVEGGPVTRIEHLVMKEIVSNVRVRGMEVKVKIKFCTFRQLRGELASYYAGPIKSRRNSILKISETYRILIHNPDTRIPDRIVVGIINY